MTVKDLDRLFDYSHWANRKLFDALSQLTDDQFTQSVAGSYGSVRNTLVHLLSAEWGWIDRCGGPPRGAALKSDDYPTVQSVHERWQHVEQIGRAFLAGLRDDDLDREVEWTLGGGPSRWSRVGDLMQHAMIHGIHHRGQIALLLRVLDHPAGNFDILFYDDRPQAERAS